MSMTFRRTVDPIPAINPPQEWAKGKPVDGPHFVVVGLPEDCVEWPELAVPWRIAAKPGLVDYIGGAWTPVPSEAAAQWARVRWDERWDCSGPVPLVMRALVTHTDGRQWRAEARIQWVVDCFADARPIEPTPQEPA